MTKGLLHKAKLGARTIRYFATAAMAEQFLQGRRISEAQRGSYRFAPDAKVVWPKGLKVQVIPPAERSADMPIRTGYYEPF